MNRFAYRTTGLALKTLSSFLKARFRIHGEKNIPAGSVIFVINHFTRIETLFLPYHIHKLTHVPVWSLADYQLFAGPLGVFLEQVGAVSTKNPDRDLLIIKSLLTGDAGWIIFPEGRMVKNKKIIEKGRFMISYAGGKRPPHTGAATLGLRTEFYRQRLRHMVKEYPHEAERLMDLFQINSLEPVLAGNTYIVPVNITYYPLRAHENALSKIAAHLREDMSDRIVEEIMTEGTMLLSGVDVDIRFGKAIEIKKSLKSSAVYKDISSQRQISFDDPIPSKQTMKKIGFQIMQHYMADIYSMTTVNHDHLFASILKMNPFKKMDTYDLRRRVFIVCTDNLKKTGIHLHHSVDSGQIHLLTDDRFHKFKDFITVAREKGVVKKHNGTLVKDSKKFSSSFDFHRVRLDNPVAVIANEIEPLKPLQKRINRVAWMPKFWLKRKIVTDLLKKEIREFEEDYKTNYFEGESKEKDVGKPFLIKGDSRDMGVVLIHGMMAAPLEIAELAAYLGKRGLWVYAPRLKGHGTSPEDLATRTYMDWMESVDTGYAIMSNICERVVVGGFSAGAGLALDLALRVKDIKGVFAVCPPMRLKDFSSKFVPAVDAWNKLMKKIRLDGAKMEFVENRPENPHINYFRIPVSAVLELEKLMDSLETRLAEIHVPALVAQSIGDPVVKPRGSRRTFKLMGSEDKSYILFNFDRHGILLGDGADKVHRAIGNFIEQLK